MTTRYRVRCKCGHKGELRDDIDDAGRDMDAHYDEKHGEQR